MCFMHVYGYAHRLLPKKASFRSARPGTLPPLMPKFCGARESYRFLDSRDNNVIIIPVAIFNLLPH
jgi:hypothetical protein